MSEEINISKIIDRGVVLNRTITKSTKELNEIKTVLREKAKEILEVEPEIKSPVPFIGKKGSATVTFKSDSYKAKDVKALSDLKANLPPALFHNLFDEEVVIKPSSSFKKKLAKLPEEQQKIILEAFDLVPNTPSVEFSK